jgi:hypothetical protein
MANPFKVLSTLICNLKSKKMKDTTHVSLAQQHSQNLLIIALGV